MVAKTKKRGIVKRAVDKVISVGSDILSLPARLKQGIKGRKYDSLRKNVKLRRAYDDAPDYDGSGSITDAFKVRSVVGGRVRDYLAKVRKQAK